MGNASGKSKAGGAKSGQVGKEVFADSMRGKSGSGQLEAGMAAMTLGGSSGSSKSGSGQLSSGGSGKPRQKVSPNKGGGYTLKLAKPNRRASGGPKERTLMSETEADAGVQAPASAFPSKKWTSEQDAALCEAVKRNDGKNWKIIAESVPGRTHVQCLQRWKKVLQPGLKKGHWEEDEDRMLTELVQKPGGQRMISWVAIAEHIPGRTAKQCRERWSLNLDPTINHADWLPAEDAKLMDLHARVGNKWAEISSYIEGRTENAVKTRYKSLVRAQEKVWTEEEDQFLIRSKRFCNSRWASISDKMPGRSKNAVRLRWRYLVSQDKRLEEPVTPAEMAAMEAHPGPRGPLPARRSSHATSISVGTPGTEGTGHDSDSDAGAMTPRPAAAAAGVPPPYSQQHQQHQHFHQHQQHQHQHFHQQHQQQYDASFDPVVIPAESMHNYPPAGGDQAQAQAQAQAGFSYAAPQQYYEHQQQQYAYPYSNGSEYNAPPPPPPPARVDTDLNAFLNLDDSAGGGGSFRAPQPPSHNYEQQQQHNYEQQQQHNYYQQQLEPSGDRPRMPSRDFSLTKLLMFTDDDAAVGTAPGEEAGRPAYKREVSADTKVLNGVEPTAAPNLKLYASNMSRYSDANIETLIEALEGNANASNFVAVPSSGSMRGEDLTVV